MFKEYVLEHVPALREVAAGLVPGALGAAVAVAVQGAMTWTQRLIQLSVGIIVSYYAGEAASELFELSPMVKNSVGFVAGVGAFEISKNLRMSLGDLAKRAPGDAWNWWLTKWDLLFGARK